MRKNEVGSAAPPGFTPGPWYVSRSDDPGCGLLVKPIPGPIVAECDPVPEMAANASVISAVPAMYSALRMFVAAVENDVEPLPGTKWYRELTAARAALAKAEAV